MSSELAFSIDSALELTGDARTTTSRSANKGSSIFSILRTTLSDMKSNTHRSQPAYGRLKFLVGLFTITMPPRLNNEPAGKYKASKNSIDNHKYPIRCFIVQKALQPVLNKGTFVSGLAGLFSKLHFPNGEWANDACP